MFVPATCLHCGVAAVCCFIGKARVHPLLHVAMDNALRCTGALPVQGLCKQVEKGKKSLCIGEY